MNWKRTKQSNAIPHDSRYAVKSRRKSRTRAQLLKEMSNKLLTDWHNDRLIWSKSYVHEMSEAYIRNSINYIDKQEKPDINSRMMKLMFIKELDKRASK